MKYKVVIDKNKLENLGFEETSLLSLIGLLEYNNLFMRLYLGDLMEKENLRDVERLLCLSASVAYLYEALTKFKSLKRRIRNDDFSHSDEFNNAWEVINSRETASFIEGVLKFIRNKSTFHIDTEVVSNFVAQGFINEWDEVIIWNGDLERTGSEMSPLVDSMIINWYIKSVGEPLPAAEKISKIYSSLRTVVRITAMHWFDARYEEYE